MSAILSRPHCVKHKVAFHAVTWVHSALRLSDPKYTRTVSQQAANVIITPLLHQIDVIMTLLLHKVSTGMWPPVYHYDDVIMSAIASRITSLTSVYLIVYSRTDQRKHQSSASLALMRGNHRRPVNSPHKGPVTRKMVPFDDVIMIQTNQSHASPPAMPYTTLIVLQLLS